MTKKCLIVEEIRYSENSNKLYVGEGNLEDWKNVPGVKPNIDCSYDVKTVSIYQRDETKELFVERVFLDRSYCRKVEDFDRQLKNNSSEHIPLNDDITAFLKDNL